MVDYTYINELARTVFNLSKSTGKEWSCKIGETLSFGLNMSSNDNVVPLKNDPIMSCEYCGSIKWYIVMKPNIEKKATHIIAFECANCHSRILADIDFPE